MKVGWYNFRAVNNSISNRTVIQKLTLHIYMKLSYLVVCNTVVKQEYSFDDRADDGSSSKLQVSIIPLQYVLFFTVV